MWSAYCFWRGGDRIVLKGAPLYTLSTPHPSPHQHINSISMWKYGGGGGVGGGDPRVIIFLYTAPKIICFSFPHNNRAYMTAGADAPYTSGCYRHIYLAQKPDIYRCLGCNRVTNSVFMLRFRFFTGQCTIMDISAWIPACAHMPTYST